MYSVTEVLISVALGIVGSVAYTGLWVIIYKIEDIGERNGHE